MDKTKTSAVAVQNALKESSHLQALLVKEYAGYKNLASFGSDLYFAVNEFAKSNVLYLLSVSSFIRLFLKTLSTFGVCLIYIVVVLIKNETVLQSNVQQDIEQQQRTLIQTLYQYMSRGMFRNFRLEFALHLVHKMYSKHITDEV